MTKDIIDEKDAATVDVAAEDKDVQENVALDIFEGEDLSEEFKDKAKVIFEAAISEAVAAKEVELAEKFETEIAKLEEESQATIETRVSEINEELVSGIDAYMEKVVDKFMTENAIAIESGIKVEKADSLIEGMKQLFMEHNIQIDEETIDVVSSLEEELSDITDVANELINDNLALEEEVAKLRAEKAFETVAEGLSDTQRDRLKVLSEKLSFSDTEEYVDDLSVIKETFFGDKTKETIAEKKEEVTVTISEQNDLDTHQVDLSEDTGASVRELANAIKKL